MPKSVFAAFLFASALCSTCFATDDLNEAAYRNLLCAGWRMEVKLERQGRADCVSGTHAIEVEWADKWKEGVGQALTYAAETDLIPGIILICRRSEKHCLASSLYVQETFSAYGIEATVWECAVGDRKLSDCLEKWVCKDKSC